MGIFDGLGKNISNAASSAAQKTKEVAEIAKLNMNINSKESDIKQLYAEIGESLYKKYRDGSMPAELCEICNKIDELATEIAELKKRITVLRKIAVCPDCGAENAESAKFCASCGITIKAEEPEPIDIAPVASVTCAGCSAENDPEARFCAQCGAELKS